MATITVADFAAELDTDPRTARKFLRSVTPLDDQPGKGSRWSIEKRDLRSLRSKFAKWTTAQEDAKAARAEAKATPAEEAPALDDDADTGIDSLEGPSDEELAED